MRPSLSRGMKGLSGGVTEGVCVGGMVGPGIFHKVHLHNLGPNCTPFNRDQAKGGCQDRGWEEGGASSRHRR